MPYSLKSVRDKVLNHVMDLTDFTPFNSSRLTFDQIHEVSGFKKNVVTRSLKDLVRMGRVRIFRNGNGEPVYRYAYTPEDRDENKTARESVNAVVNSFLYGKPPEEIEE